MRGPFVREKEQRDPVYSTESAKFIQQQYFTCKGHLASGRHKTLVSSVQCDKNGILMDFSDAKTIMRV